MGQANADNDGVLIMPLEGSADLYQLMLSDTPNQRVKVGGDLRSVVTHYPGSSKPSTQIMGTKDDDIVLEGTFRDDWYGLDGHAMAQMTAFRSLWRSQLYCEMNWGQALVRRGYVKRAEFDIVAEGHIDYRLTFQVVEADEASVIAKPFAAQETPFDLLAMIREITQAAEDLLDATILVNNVLHAVT